MKWLQMQLILMICLIKWSRLRFFGCQDVLNGKKKIVKKNGSQFSVILKIKIYLWLILEKKWNIYFVYQALLPLLKELF